MSRRRGGGANTSFTRVDAFRRREFRGLDGRATLVQLRRGASGCRLRRRSCFDSLAFHRDADLVAARERVEQVHQLAEREPHEQRFDAEDVQRPAAFRSGRRRLPTCA